MRYLSMFMLASAVMLLAFMKKDPFIVKGSVHDVNGAPVVGATVRVKASQKATTTDQYGFFSIEVPSEGTILQIHAVGFESLEVKASKQKTLHLTMEQMANRLDEVVVTGYSGVRKKELTGAMAALPGQPLQGQSAGVNIRVRGYSSMSADSKAKRSSQVYGMRATGPGNGVPGSAEVEYDREGYDYLQENRFLKVDQNPLSTFSIDVDAASYANVRRFIQQGQVPPKGAVRVEEMINYFRYNYPQPLTEDPFAVHTEMTDCPWNPQHRLVMIGLQGKTIPTDNLPASNLVFLIDVSGSMQDPNKLPLVKASMKMLTDQLREQDRVSIVVYAGAAGIVLTPTSGADKMKIKASIDALEAGGSTAGGAGIRLAYKTAREQFREGGNNRVILCTDGDFNVGESSDDAMERLIEQERASGVFLTVLGYGMGNYQDAKMQKLADKGNGNHAYIDQLSEAKKVLISEFGGTLFTIAKDVKLQIEFNPALVQGYRLVGYENRILAKEDFNNDRKDAGDMGSGHTVTAFYEIIPVGVQSGFLDSVDALKYQRVTKATARNEFGMELMNVKLRYKKPDGMNSKLLVHPVRNQLTSWKNASENFRFAASVAGFGLLLRDSPFKGNLNYPMVRDMAASAMGADAEGYRREFITLVDNMKAVAGK